MMWEETAVRFYWQDPHQQTPKYFPKKQILSILQASLPPVGGHVSRQGSVTLPLLTCLPYSSWWVWFIRLMLRLEWDSQQSIALWPTLWEVRGGRKAPYLRPEHTLFLIFEKQCGGSLEVVPRGDTGCSSEHPGLISTPIWQPTTVFRVQSQRIWHLLLVFEHQAHTWYTDILVSKSCTNSVNK